MNNSIQTILEEAQKSQSSIRSITEFKTLDIRIQNCYFNKSWIQLIQEEKQKMSFILNQENNEQSLLLTDFYGSLNSIGAAAFYNKNNHLFSDTVEYCQKENIPLTLEFICCKLLFSIQESNSTDAAFVDLKNYIDFFFNKQVQKRNYLFPLDTTMIIRSCTILEEISTTLLISNPIQGTVSSFLDCNSLYKSTVEAFDLDTLEISLESMKSILNRFEQSKTFS